MVDSKSHDSDELVTLLANKFESLSTRLEKLEDQVKKQNESSEKIGESLETLNETVKATNEVFDQVATGIKDLYEKVKTFEVVAKLMNNFQNLGPLLGGLGGGGQSKRP